jgi:hypothetical protein
MVTAGPPVRGACYGYEIRSELEFGYLRLGGGEALEVSPGVPRDEPPGDLLRELRPPRFPTHVKLHADGAGYRMWVDGGGWFAIDPHAPKIVVPPEAEPVRREERLWGLPVLLCFLARGDLPLHASCVEIDGKALLLAAPGRFGKTTLAAAFAAAGHRVLAEDLVCLRPGPPPSVVPGAAMLRVRLDVVDAFRIPGAKELLRDGDRAHLSLASSRGTCDPVPLAGIAFLNEADVDPRLDGVSTTDVVRDLWTVSFKLPTNEDRARSFRAAARLAASTTTWRLSRRLRLDELGATLDCLVDAVRADHLKPDSVRCSSG